MPPVESQAEESQIKSRIIFRALTPAACSPTVRAFREAPFQPFPRTPIPEAEAHLRLGHHAHLGGWRDDRRRGAHCGARGDDGL